MSTRCNIIVEDDRSRIQLYRHSDGYPDTEHGVLNTLREVFPYAWPLPRFEVKEFSAAIVAAWKASARDYVESGYSHQGGNIYIDGNPEGDELLHGDIEYLYIITHSTEEEEKCIHVEVRNIHRKETRHYVVCPEEPEEPSDSKSGKEPMLGGKG